MIRYGEFFAGVGGFRLGLNPKKFECVFANEIDPWCEKTYNLNFSSPKLTRGDISELSIESLPPMDLIVGGFPCQAFSIAGKREGFSDPRGQIFFSLVRIIEAKKPSMIVLENVKNILFHDTGKSFQLVCQSLTDIGYHLKHAILDTGVHSNLPQHRERCFMVGSRDPNVILNWKFPSPIHRTTQVVDYLDSTAPEKYHYTPRISCFPLLKQEIISEDIVYQYRRTHVRANKSGVCPTLTANMGTGGHNVPIIIQTGKIRKLTPRECFRLQGFPEDYQLSNIADSHLYCQAGNAVSIPIISALGSEIESVWT